MKIGITYTGSRKKHQNYVDWLNAEENIQIIELSLESKNLNEVNSCDGVVLSGGVDIYPPVYKNQNLDYPNVPKRGFQKERDKFEFDVLKLAEENNLPVLGICRGMQLINCFYGGDLVQDIGDFNKIHMGNPDKLHLVCIEEGTILSSIIYDRQVTINSAHHQAIKNLGSNLTINAKSNEDIIEGIERTVNSNKSFLLGVQWHPERMYEFKLENSYASKAIRERFIQEIRNSLLLKNESH